MNNTTKEACTGTGKLSPEAEKKRRQINKNIFKFGCLPIIGLFTLIIFIGVFESSKTGAGDYSNALSEYNSLKYEKALDYINKAILKDSIKSDYYELRGKILHELQDTIHSNEDLNKTILLSHTLSEKRDKLQQIIDWDIGHGKISEAKILLKQEIELYKNDTINHTLIIEDAVNKYLKIGDTIEAINLYNNIDKYYPESGKYNNLIGVLYSRTKKNNKAISEFKKAIKKEPKNDIFLYHLGVSYLNIKSKRNAKKYFKSSMELGNKSACKEYRELSARTRYYKRSRCCDGSTSSSLGRGTCSHHGGVCRIENVPYKEYTINCN